MNPLPLSLRRGGAFALVALLALTSGCSSFHRDWRAAGKLPTPSDTIQGRWEGSWVSNENGHHGRLRCLLTKDETNRYQARFHAKYKRILSFSYTVPLEVEGENSSARFTGEADLGTLAGGIYTYAGNASPTNFFSTYKSKYDHGTFQMTRPE